MAVLVEGALGIGALTLAWMFRVPLREQLPADGHALAWTVARGVLATLPMLAAFLWLMRSALPELVQLREQVQEMVDVLFPAGNLAQLALVAALAGVGEELLFRGVLQSLGIRWTTPAIGLVGASLLFGLAHALSRVYFFFALAVGLYLGGLAMHYHDVLAPMIAHGLYDFLALAYFCKFATDPQSDESIPSQTDDEPAEIHEPPTDQTN